MSKVIVTADKNGNIINVSENNPEYGSIRVVQQDVIEINEKGFLKQTVRSAFIKGKINDLIQAKYQEGSTISGKIIVKESFEPFNPVNPDKNLKIAGDTGIICRVGDQPIYRETFFTQNLNATDNLIAHDNKDEIVGVQIAKKSLLSLAIKKPKDKSVNL
jgi:hypothetical protein